MSLNDYARASEEFEREQRCIQPIPPKEEDTAIISLNEFIRMKKKNIEKVLSKINAKLLMATNDNVERLSFNKFDLDLNFDSDLENPYLIEALEKAGYVVKFEYDPTLLIIEGW